VEYQHLGDLTNIVMSSHPASPPPSCARVKDCADAILTRCGLWKNPYFETLRDGRMSLEAFRRSQEQFYFAVAFFSRPMAALVARLPDYASRVNILHNVVEEHGDFRLNDSHAKTFEAFLRRLGSGAEDLHNVRPSPAVHAFNSVLFSACMLEALEIGIGCVGIIEYAFAEFSALIGSAIVDRGWIPREEVVHYALHAELDRRHADEFFVLLEPGWDHPEKREGAERGLALGAHAFDRLYRDLLSVAE
jgi:pyrroloquinoline-quinone synthase